MTNTETKMAPATYSNKQVGVHITKVKCTPSGHGVRQFLLYCTVYSGKNAGNELHVPMKAAEAEATFKLWTDLTAMPTHQEYVFDVDDRPIASVVYRNNQPNYASDVKADYGYRAKLASQILDAANLHPDHHIYNNRQLGDLREKIGSFNTTADMKQWLAEYIEEKKTVTDKPAELDELTEELGRSVITRDTKSRKEYFARVNAIMERYGYDPALYDETSKTALCVNSHDDYGGASIDAAVRTVLFYCMDKKPDSEATMQDFKALLVNGGYEAKDFKAATGYANRKDAYDNGKTASELYQTIENWIAGKKQKSNEKATSSGDKQSEPPTTPNETKQNEIERSSVAGNIIQIPNLKSGICTITGIDILDIPAALNAHLPPEAYSPIKEGMMTGKTDVDADYIRNRLDQVFGGLCWRISPNPVGGGVVESIEERTNSKGQAKTWYVYKLIAHTFQYAARMPDGTIQWIDASTTSDQHDNVDEQFAKRGAMTAIMKQFYKMLGGMDHIVFNEYTHIQAQQDIASRRKKAS